MDNKPDLKSEDQSDAIWWEKEESNSVSTNETSSASTGTIARQKDKH